MSPKDDFVLSGVEFVTVYVLLWFVEIDQLDCATVTGSLITSHSLPLQSHEDKAHFLTVVNAVLIGALMAFFMEIAEYLVVTFTSSLTLSVAGIFKVA